MDASTAARQQVIIGWLEKKNHQKANLNTVLEYI